MSTAYKANVPIVAIDGDLPSQTSITNGKALISNGSTASWQPLTAMIGTNPGQVTPTALTTAILPSQTGNSGKVLQTDGTTASWVAGPVGYTGSQGIIGYTGSAVAGTAPLASPAFTGNPTAPTPPTTDNDTSIATSAFVKNAIAAANSSSNGIPGWTKLPNGIIIQWWRDTFDTTGVLNTTFPVPFTATVFHVSGHALLSAGPPFFNVDAAIVGWDANNTSLTSARMYSINYTGSPQAGTEVFLAIGV